MAACRSLHDGGPRVDVNLWWHSCLEGPADRCIWSAMLIDFTACGRCSKRQDDVALVLKCGWMQRFPLLGNC